jgi:iron complex transport system permease protein
VQVGPLRRGVYLVASLATAAAVTQAGSIGFVGLIVPHLVRLAVGNDQRLLLPASILAGGSLLVIADTLARTLIAPQQLPGRRADGADRRAGLSLPAGARREGEGLR